LAKDDGAFGLVSSCRRRSPGCADPDGCGHDLPCDRPADRAFGKRRKRGSDACIRESIDTGELRAFFDTLIPGQLAADHVAGAVAVVQDGQLLYAQGYGYADVAQQTSVVATAPSSTSAPLASSSPGLP
jgi:CubicO group peptidase (beta-lactamase class C family)